MNESLFENGYEVGAIPVQGRFWSEAAHGKIVHAEQVYGLEETLNLNIENGKDANGNIIPGSLQTKQFTAENEQWISKANGIASFAFGKDCNANGKRAIAWGTGITSNGNTSFTIGQTNTNEGNATFVSGNQNTVEKKYSLNPQQSAMFGQFNSAYNAWSLTAGKNNENHAMAASVLGWGNTNTEKGISSLVVGGCKADTDDKTTIGNINNGGCNIIGGQGNNVTIHTSIVSGKLNKITSGNDSIVGGSNNTINKLNNSIVVGSYNTVSGAYKKDENGALTTDTDESQSNIVVGNQNAVNTSYSAVFGNKNIVNNYEGNKDYCFVAGNNNESKAARNVILGQGLLSTQWRQVVLGSYNNANEKGVLLVGCGTGSSDKRNGFVVTWDGRAKVKTAPTDDDDIIRLQELKEFSNSIQFVTNDEIDDLWQIN